MTGHRDDAAAPRSGRLAEDGPRSGAGVDAEQRDTVLARGARLDESVPGSRLGLAIVQELAGLYGGQLRLDTATHGGLRAELTLPIAI